MSFEYHNPFNSPWVGDRLVRKMISPKPQYEHIGHVIGTTEFDVLMNVPSQHGVSMLDTEDPDTLATHLESILGEIREIRE